MYYNKPSMDRLSKFAKASKNLLLYGSSGSPDKPKMNYQVKVEPEPMEKPAAAATVTVTVANAKVKTPLAETITQEDLQQAIIWSEILGKPKCKSRERRAYGN